MKPVAVLVLCVLSCQTDGVHITDPDRNSSAVIRRVDLRFLSVTIDASLASEEKFMYLLR